MTAYAEVIGDPIAHSRSPAIHRHWLEKVGIDGDYRAVRVERADLASYVEGRRSDLDWRGCNVTIPHKESIAALLDEIASDAAAIGAVNCVVRESDRLVGYNTDVSGIAGALGAKPLGSRHVAIIGAGGAARAMLAYLSGRGPARVTLLARDQAKARNLYSLAGSADVRWASLDEADTALEGAALIVNASPLGMDGSERMPETLLEAVEANARGTILFDMVYQPLATDFLRRGTAAGGEPVDGLAMLIGQARSAFERFFRAEPPAGDKSLRTLLTGSARSVEAAAARSA
jgi:shikimate dehydrogenase